jgi:hypothetical protein
MVPRAGAASRRNQQLRAHPCEALRNLPDEHRRLVDVLEYWAYHPEHTLAPELLNNVAQTMLRRETSALPLSSAGSTEEEQRMGAAACQQCSVEHLASLALLMRGAAQTQHDQAWLVVLRELAAITRTLVNASTDRAR